MRWPPFKSRWRTMNEQLEDLAMRLCNLSHGDEVRTGDSKTGWVIDFDSNSQPIVFFPHLASARLISKNEYLVKLGEIPLQPGRRIVQAATTFKMPLDYG